MSLPTPPLPLSTPSRPRPRHRSSKGAEGGSFDANASLDSQNPALAGLSLSGFTPGGPVPAGYSYLDKAAPLLRTSTRSGGRSQEERASKKKAPRPATRFVPPRPSSPVSPHDRAIPNSVSASSSFSSPPRPVPTLAALNASLSSLASLPSDPRNWSPAHVSLYLSHVLSLAPRPVIEDVSRFVRSEQMGGPGFLRLRDGQLEQRGMNPRWRRLLCEASARLRRDALRRKIWSHGHAAKEEEPHMDDLLQSVPDAGELTPGQQRLMTATLKRIRDRKAVRGLIEALESPPKGTDLELPAMDTPTKKIRDAFHSRDTGSLGKGSPQIEAPFGQGYVLRQARSFSSQDNLAQLAREEAKVARPPKSTRKWQVEPEEGKEQHARFESIPSSVSLPAWAPSHSHTMSASSSSSSSISTVSSTAAAEGYESDFSSEVTTDSEIGAAEEYEGQQQQEHDWLAIVPFDEHDLKAILEEDDEQVDSTQMYEPAIEGDDAKEILESQPEPAVLIAVPSYADLEPTSTNDSVLGATPTPTNRRLVSDAANASSVIDPHEVQRDVFGQADEEPQDSLFDEATVRPRAQPVGEIEDEGQFDTIRLDDVQKARREASNASSSSSSEGEGQGWHSARRSLQLSEIFAEPAKEAMAEEAMAEEVEKEYVEAAPALVDDVSPKVVIEDAAPPPYSPDVAMAKEDDSLSLESTAQEMHGLQSLNLVAEPAGHEEQDVSFTAAGVLDELIEEIAQPLERQREEQPEETDESSKPQGADILAPAEGEDSMESSCENSTILHLIHTRDASAASSTLEDFTAIPTTAPPALNVEENASQDDACGKLVEVADDSYPSQRDEDHSIYYGDASSLMLLSTLLPERSEDELLVTEHRRILSSASKLGQQEGSEEATSSSSPPARHSVYWSSWRDMLARTPPYLVGLAAGAAFVVVSEVILAARRR